jgi:hypothetical protein
MVEVTVRVDASTRAALEAASSSAVASTAELTSQSDHRVEAEMAWVPYQIGYLDPSMPHEPLTPVGADRSIAESSRSEYSR